MGFKVGKSSAISDDGDQNSIIVHSRNVRDSCLHTIDEQKAGIDESDWESNEEYVAAVLANCKRTWFESLKYHLGYPLEYNVEYGSLSCLQPFPINNFGDPFMESNYGVNSKDFEVWVLDWFARLWEIQKDEYWGYVTHGGTEANLQALLMARGMFPDGIVYTSKESHFSIFKAAWMFRMNCIEIETLITGEIDCEDLKNKLYKNKDKPAIINLNIGTTFKGAVDDVDMVTQTLEECAFPRNKYYIHCDGALAGLILPFVEQAPQMTFKKPIDSISVSGHKLLACPMPCGILITRINHIDPLSTNIEYIASRYATISCSRNGHTPIFLWYMLSRKGHTGLQQDVQRCLQNARYLQTRLMDAGISVMLNQLSNIVVFERPPDQEFIRKWQLSCQGNIAHVVVMFNMSKEKLDDFIHELIKKRSSWFKDGNSQLPCVANDIGEENCVCPLHTT